MSFRIVKALCLLWIVSLGQGFYLDALAAKLNARPLPRERELKDFDHAQTIAPATSRFYRRPDFREEELRKKQAQEDAVRQSAESEAKARAEQIFNYRQNLDQALKANNKGVALGKQGRWGDAIQAHETAIQLDPQNKQYRINLSAARCAFGQSRLAAADLTAAASLFRKALSAAPDNGLAGKLLAEALKRQGRDPHSADVRLSLGDQLASAGNYEGATIEYQCAMQLEPSARTYLKIGDMALHYGQIATAVNWYQQAIVKDPNYGAPYRQLGLIAYAQKDYTAAGTSLRKAIILDPKDVAAGAALVEIWRRQVANNPLLAENHLGLAGALQLTGDFIGAENEYRKLEALDPKHAGLEAGRASLAKALQHAKAEKHRLAAETLISQGLRREALAQISQAVMLEPRNAKYQYALGECLEANGDYQGAHQAYLTCVLIDPENNKEAAARMKEMQGTVNNVVRSQPNNQAWQTNFSAPATFPQGSLPKNMFEGGVGFKSALLPTQALRTHEESQANATTLPLKVKTTSSSVQAAAACQQQVPSTLQATASDQNNQNIFNQNNLAKNMTNNIATYKAAIAEVEAAEGQKDYSAAIALLNKLLQKNLENPEVHHKLAVNFLANGQISEAISEFRIASALAPNNRDYAEDLARALVIHKRSLPDKIWKDSSSSAKSGANAFSSKEVAAK